MSYLARVVASSKVTAKAELKELIKSVTKYIDVDLDGTVHEQKYSIGLENDLNIMWAKDFWQKWCKKILGEEFSEVFKDDDFGGQDERASYEGDRFEASVVYKIVFKDGSSASAQYDVGDTSGHMEVNQDEGDAKSMAHSFSSNSNAYEWDTDVLDALAKK